MAYLDSTGLQKQIQYIKAYVANQISAIASNGTVNRATADGLGNNIAETYATKAELSAIPQFDIQVVNALPTANISDSTVYLVLSNDGAAGNLYTEYIYVNDTWEKLGEHTTEVDLSGYMPKSGGTFTGNVMAPTPEAADNSTKVATTAYVNTKLGEYSTTSHTHNYAGSASAGGAATSANKLATGKAIDGVTFDGSAAIVHYGTCSTAAATAAKTVACTSFTLVTGSRIVVKFTVTNTAANPTLNVNSTGAKAIQYRGAAISAGYLAANRTYEFIYDGTNYQLVGDIDTNTTYSAGTTALLVTGSDTANRVWPVKQLVDYIKPRSVEFIKGTQTAATGAFTGVTTDAALYDGKTIRYYLPYAGSGNATLNLTLSGGGTTGAKVIYWSGTSQLTTHYGAGSVMTLTYVASDDKWHGADYNSNTTNSAGAGNSTAKLFLVGTTAQSTGTSYSNANVYATNGALHASSISTGGNVVVGGTANTNYLQLPSGIKLY